MTKKLLSTLSLIFFVWASVFAQEFSTFGKVTSENGDPIAGANVVVKGTTMGTITGADGKYTIKYPKPNVTLVVSMVGYQNLEVSAFGKKELDITLLDGVAMRGVEVVGSRSLNRSATQTAVPIDIIPIATVTNQVGQIDLNQLLQFVAPSFNSNRQSGSDGSDHIDPATLRGLSPDQTLVLINGKRRHQSSLVNLYGTRGRGSTGTDLNTIPASAIERIEILRDGAAAQYGSDAIAGVINIVLKSDVNQISTNINTGIYKAGDGLTTGLNANYGFAVGDGGYVNVTADYQNRDRTNRAVDSLYRRQFGDAAVENYSAVLNAKIPLRGNAEIYAFGGMNHRFGDAFAWSRDADSKRNIPSIYPKGFDPHIQSVIDDKSMSVGVRGAIGKWNTDFNNTFGVNRFHYYVDGTLNASMLEKSPTRFDAGGFAASQNSTGFGLSRYFGEVMSGLNVAFGSEYRIDNYLIFAGEEASWQNYGGKWIGDDDGDGITDTLARSGGAQGFPGFRPSNELNESRTNLAAYGDVELDVNKNFMINAALRAEKYSDFGNTLNWKLATRYKINEKFLVRASASTGFRAPSLAQRYFNALFTNFVSGVAIEQYLANNSSNIARALKIDPLRQETSQNLSLGITLKPIDNLSITVDAYQVAIKDKIVLTGLFDSEDTALPAGARTELAKLGVGSAQFFANALNTNTRGIDAIISYNTLLGKGVFTTSLAANFNKMTLGAIKTSSLLPGTENYYFGEREKRFLLASAPNSKINLTLNYKIGKINTNVRFVRFDSVLLQDWLGRDDFYKANYTTDLSLGYEICKGFNFVLGGSNLFNAFPTGQDIETEGGGLYDSVQMGIGGAYFFGRLAMKF